MAALSVKQGTKTDYHVFQHFPNEAVEALSKLGIDTNKAEQDGMLDIWDSYTATTEYEAAEKRRTEFLAGEQPREKPLNLRKSAEYWNRRVKEGFTELEKDRLHFDDNCSIFLQYNDEKTMVDVWRTAVVPVLRARGLAAFHAFVRGSASAEFFTKFEALCDGVVDLKAEEEGGRIENYIRIRILRGKKFDSRWHRIELMDNSEVALEVARPEEPRRLAAIMFTDIVGYTAMTQANESHALDLLRGHRELLRPIIVNHGGSEVKTMGDAILVEFSSALAALECAVDMERVLRQYNKGKGQNLQVKIGIHVGDVVHESGDVYGDAVNIASRIEPLAQGGGTCVSQQVYDQVRNKTTFRFSKLETHELKNVSVPIDVYKVESS